LEQRVPAPCAVVQPPETGERRQVAVLDFEGLAIKRERLRLVGELELGDLTGAMQELEPAALVGRAGDLELERAHEVLEAAGALGGALQRVDRAEVLAVDVENAAKGRHGARGLPELIFLEPPDLEEPGDLALGVGGEVDGALVELEQRGVLAGLSQEPLE